MIKSLFVRLSALFALALLAGGALASTPEAAEQLVLRVTEQVLATIKQDREIKGGNAARIVELVDTQILPHVNFTRMTQLAAGRHWRTATPEQREALVREFRLTLVRTYSGAVSAVKDQTSVQLRPSRNEAGAREVIVRTQIVQPAADPIPVDYRLELTDAGWKIFDVNVLGIWLVENYRNQFNQQITQGGGIDALIRNLAERNRSFLASAR
jgi:phospholipid transport system substrate-binding protein